MKVGDFRAARAISSPVAAAWPRIPTRATGNGLPMRGAARRI